MPSVPYLPLLELTRGETVESIHFGAIAIVSSHGQTLGVHGDPQTITYLRSSAKPLQALPFIESGGAEYWGFSAHEVAIICASHSGSDDHYNLLLDMQAKIGITQEHLRCGTHAPTDPTTAKALLLNGEEPTPNRHNCSGKHTGMLAFAQMKSETLEDYLDPQHPIQQQILLAFSEMCDIEPEKIALGTDGCSAPNFAIPLWNTALGFARLVDPWKFSTQRAKACEKIFAAMYSHPEMVAGPGKFDTRLMTAASGKLISKGGAEGYLAIGILPGVLRPDSPGVGIAIKISDGDPKGRARPAVALEILTHLGVLTTEEAETMADLGPKFPIFNWREILIGEGRPTFKLDL
jgi:L-asparaginase II